MVARATIDEIIALRLRRDHVRSYLRSIAAILLSFNRTNHTRLLPQRCLIWSSILAKDTIPPRPFSSGYSNEVKDVTKHSPVLTSYGSIFNSLMMHSYNNNNNKHVMECYLFEWNSVTLDTERYRIEIKKKKIFSI